MIIKTGAGNQKRWVLRLFAGSWSAIFAGTAYLLRDQPPMCRLTLLALAAACAAGLLLPALMRHPYRWVEILLAPVGRLFAFLMLALVFFGVFTPFSLGLRLVGWDPLRRQGRRSGTTAWRTLSAKAERSDYRWQY